MELSSWLKDFLHFLSVQITRFNDLKEREVEAYEQEVSIAEEKELERLKREGRLNG